MENGDALLRPLGGKAKKEKKNSSLNIPMTFLFTLTGIPEGCSLEKLLVSNFSSTSSDMSL